MRVVIAVATADAALRTLISTKRDLIVPPEAVAKGYLRDANVRFSPQILAIGAQTTQADLGQWLRRLAASADGLILLIDATARHLAAEYEDAYFVASLAEPNGKFVQNYIRSTLATVLKHFSVFSQRFDSLNFQRILLLPLDIFLAEDLRALRTRLTHAKMLPCFGQDLDLLIARMRERARPKTRTRFKTFYLVDDRPLWFRYGPEMHAVVQTTVPPHDDKCWHNSVFRFGRAYNCRLHHNVDDDSIPTAVHGEFFCCHRQVFVATGQSHLNIFPNGFL